jgi:cation diffusion facilitator family transporter
MAGNSKVAIYGAIFANLGIAIMKWVAAFYTGSAAMISEGIHSFVDSFNGILLLYGIKRSQQKPDARHPFGYGKEVYFWAFVVAVFIFALGGGIAIYEGINHVMHPHAPEPGTMIWSYSVLIGAMVLESISFWLAFREFRKTMNGGIIKSLRESKDAATFAVLLEDSAALVGLVIALIGITLADYYENPIIDGVTSICIGVLLALVAVFLARETKGLLLGESATDANVADIDAILVKRPSVMKWGEIRTMHLGPNTVLLALNIDFANQLDVHTVETEIQAIEQEIMALHPHISKIYIETTDLS